MVTRYSKVLMFKIFTRVKCSKSINTTVLPEITCLLWITKNICDAFCEAKGFDEDSDFLPFSDLSRLDMVKIER